MPVLTSNSIYPWIAAIGTHMWSNSLCIIKREVHMQIGQQIVEIFKFIGSWINLGFLVNVCPVSKLLFFFLHLILYIIPKRTSIIFLLSIQQYYNDDKGFEVVGDRYKVVPLLCENQFFFVWYCLLQIYIEGSKIFHMKTNYAKY